MMGVCDDYMIDKIYAEELASASQPRSNITISLARL